MSCCTNKLFSDSKKKPSHFSIVYSFSIWILRLCQTRFVTVNQEKIWKTHKIMFSTLEIQSQRENILTVNISVDFYLHLHFPDDFKTFQRWHAAYLEFIKYLTKLHYKFSTRWMFVRWNFLHFSLWQNLLVSWNK